MWTDPSAILIIGASLRGLFVLPLQEGTFLSLSATKCGLIAHVVGLASIPLTFSITTRRERVALHRWCGGLISAVSHHQIFERSSITSPQGSGAHTRPLPWSSIKSNRTYGWDEAWWLIQ